jgi:hypothetical protein
LFLFLFIQLVFAATVETNTPTWPKAIADIAAAFVQIFTIAYVHIEGFRRIQKLLEKDELLKKEE